MSSRPKEAAGAKIGDETANSSLAAACGVGIRIADSDLIADLELPLWITQSPPQHGFAAIEFRPSCCFLQQGGILRLPPSKQPQTAAHALPAIIRIKNMATKRFNIRHFEL